MAGSTYKTTAVALQGRRLVTVSKRHGVWSAILTDAGRYYLEHGRYPGPATPARRPAATLWRTTSSAAGAGKNKRTPAPDAPARPTAEPATAKAGTAETEPAARDYVLGEVARIEKYRADRLLDEANRWDTARRLRDYLQALRTAIGSATDTEAAASARRWLAWAERYTTEIDPLADRLPGMPEPPR